MPCPACSSDEWKLASLVHKEGVSHVSTTTSGIGIAASTSGVGLAGGRGKTAGVQQSQLSKEAAPPPGLVLTAILIWLSAFAIIFAILALTNDKLLHFTWLFIVGVVAAVGAFRVYPGEKAKVEAAMAKWQVTRMCLRCGTFYVPPDVRSSAT
jgi:multisubunit Na+/H+ antiporter MnhC subunit